MQGIHVRHIIPHHSCYLGFWSVWHITYRSGANMFVGELCEIKASNTNPVPVQLEEGIAFRPDDVDAF